MDLMQRRRVMLAAGKRLPAGYTLLKKLISNGNQRINTTFIAQNVNETDQFEFHFEPLDTTAVNIYFGTEDAIYNTSYRNARLQLPLVGSKLRNDLAGSETVFFGTPPISEEITYTINNLTATCLGSTLPIRGSDSNFRRYLWLFCQGHSNLTTNAKMAFLSATWKKAGEIKMDLLPALRDADSKPGIYDMATGNFLVNDLTKEFGYETMNGTIVQPQS